MYMKRLFVVMILAGIGCTIFIGGAEAQTTRKKKAPVKRVNTKKKTTAVAPAVVPIDSIALGLKEAPASASDSLPLGKVELSLRNNSAVDNNLIKEKTPLAYEYLREDDQMYKQALWRNIDTKEKINEPFRYEADEDNGNQRFINILLQAIQNGDVTAFNGINDRF